MEKLARIGRLSDGKYRVYSRTGKNLGTYNSHYEAKKRLIDVEMFKHMKNRKAVFFELNNIIKESTEITTTYSAVMRKLRKKHPEKVLDFMKAFHRAFNQAINEKLDDSESVALLEALQMIEP